MQQRIQFIDHFHLLNDIDPLYMFAIDEWVADQMEEDSAAICHIWRHPHAVILGAQDSRLPAAIDGVKWLQSTGLHVAVRNSGGLAVPLDEGVVNISIILPLRKEQSNDYWADFERMYQWIKRALISTGKQVERGLIEGAYCPGDYDLSIDGWKFCGLAQRRKRKATIMQGFIVAEGEGVSRAALARDFYYIASKQHTVGNYPNVSLTSTASLQQLTNLGEAAGHTFVTAFKQQLREHFISDPLNSEPIAIPEEELEALVRTFRTRYAIEG